TFESFHSIMLLCALVIFLVLAGETCLFYLITTSFDLKLVTLYCNYTAYRLHWYRQKAGSKLEFLLLIDKSTKFVVPASPPLPHMSTSFHNNNRVDLIISSAAVSDSALYYCALEPTVTGKPATQYKSQDFAYLQSSMILCLYCISAIII
uniref:T-cell receptor alpha/delta variable 2.0.4 n=1 Tax=Sinocyclocheilus rhinocerous TaxID=307959 RepID=A0A673GVB4_9TELE